MEKDMKFTTAGEWLGENEQYSFDPLMTDLENFNYWFRLNTQERKDSGLEPYTHTSAVTVYCEYYGVVSGITPEKIQKEYEKVVDTKF